MKKLLLILLPAILVFSMAGCDSKKNEVSMLEKQIAQFADVEIKYDASLLDDNQKIVVDKLFQAAKVIDELFLEQAYSKNIEIRNNLIASDSETDKVKLKYFNIMFGPFDRLSNYEPFIGNDERPVGANFYPADMTKEEFNNWISEHPEDEAAFTSEFTVIRRDGDKLIAVPYNEEYKEQLDKVSTLLREAAEYADNETLKNYLVTRAKSFETNDYFESDMAWMDLKDHTIEVIIGPYEVYEDELFNYKAAFECFITLVDPVESKKLDIFADYLDDIEQNLPYPDEHKNFDRGSESPIVVVQEVFSAGDTKSGVQTLAFNLPNDERVRQAKGSKKVMLKNIHEAKFEKQLTPISQKIISEYQLQYVTFDAFFNHTLMHEISHGVGPGFITVDGRETEVKKELKELYSKIEECKADVLGMYNDIFMIEKGVYPESFAKENWTTFLAGIFRSIRFGIGSAHATGNAIIFNYLLNHGAYNFDNETETVSINYEVIYDVIKDLANKLLMIQATGDYDAAKQLIADYGVENETIILLRDKLNDIPIDIYPVFQIAKK